MILEAILKRQLINLPWNSPLTQLANNQKFWLVKSYISFSFQQIWTILVSKSKIMCALSKKEKKWKLHRRLLFYFWSNSNTFLEHPAVFDVPKWRWRLKLGLHISYNYMTRFIVYWNLQTRIWSLWNSYNNLTWKQKNLPEKLYRIILAIVITIISTWLQLFNPTVVMLAVITTIWWSRYTWTASKACSQTAYHRSLRLYGH